MKNILLICIAILVVQTSCKKESASTSENKTTENFAELLASYNEGKLRLNPIEATFFGDKKYTADFPNFLSDDYRKDLKSFYQTTLNELDNFKDEDLTESQQMSKAVLKWDCNMALAQASFKKDILLPIDQMWSVNLIMGQFAIGSAAQPFNTVQDYTNWLSRLEQYNIWLQTAKTRMQEGIAEGYVLPKSLIVKVIPQFESLTIVNKNSEGITDYSNHLFLGAIQKFPETFTSKEKEELTNEYTSILSDKLIPSFKELALFLKSDYLNAGRTSSGFLDLPNGDDYYNHAIKFYTTTNMSADEIHELGKKEVARILSEMEKVKNEVGFKGSLKEFFDFVRTNKELMPYKTAKEVLDNFNAIHKKMMPQLNKLFGNKPKTQFIVKQTEKFREASASAEYNPGSLNDNRPGVFYTPIPDATTYNGFQDEALFLHEAIPGHHYQIALTQENEDLPDFRKTLWYSAYGEGWALYTENLGKELGLYTDPYQYFGMLGMEMHRAIRLVVDTGIHAKGWSREKAIQYSLDNEAESEAGITSEIERYMANPGQALSYKIGQLKIRELRAKAKKTLGDKFDIKEFHNQVLETGCIPLALLENKINQWIKESL